MHRYRRPDGTVVTEYAGVGFTSDCFCYSDRGKRARVVHRSGVRRAELVFGVQAQHPVLMILVGALLVCTLAWPVLRVARVAGAGGELYGYDFLVGVPALFGGWLVRDAARRGWTLRFELGRRVVKLAFDKDAEIGQLREFVRRASAETGLRIGMP